MSDRHDPGPDMIDLQSYEILRLIVALEEVQQAAVNCTKCPCFAISTNALKRLK